MMKSNRPAPQPSKIIHGTTGGPNTGNGKGNPHAGKNGKK
jgi:hypothetical protein